MRDPIKERMRRSLQGMFGGPEAMNSGSPFGGQQQGFQGIFNPRNQPQPQQTEPNAAQNMQDLFNQPRAAMNAYKQHISDMPQYQTPNWKQKLLAGLAGGLTVAGGERPMAGVSLTQGLLEEPYQRQMEGWTNKGRMLREHAELEDADIENRIRGLKEQAAMQNIMVDNEREDFKAERYGEAQDALVEERRGKHEYYTKHRPELDKQNLDIKRKAGESVAAYRDRQARAAEARVGVARQNASSLDRYRGRMATAAETRANRAGEKSGPSVTQQIAGEKEALGRIAADANYGKYFELDPLDDQPRLKADTPKAVKDAVYSNVNRVLADRGLKPLGELSAPPEVEEEEPVEEKSWWDKITGMFSGDDEEEELDEEDVEEIDLGEEDVEELDITGDTEEPDEEDTVGSVMVPPQVTVSVPEQRAASAPSPRYIDRPITPDMLPAPVNHFAQNPIASAIQPGMFAPGSGIRPDQVASWWEELNKPRPRRIR